MAHTTTKSYWRKGDEVGCDQTTTDDADLVVCSFKTRPSGATDITEGEFDAAVVAIKQEREDAREARLEALEEHKAEIATLRASARTKLTTGDPLTPEEAAVLVP
jgi:hypothetical protein